MAPSHHENRGKGNWSQYNAYAEHPLYTAAADFLCTFTYPQRAAIGRRQGKVAALCGITYWSLLFLIAVCYLLVLQIFMNNAHFKYDDPMGSLKMALIRPTALKENSDQFCNPLESGCTNDFQDVTTLPYCKRSDLPYDGGKQDCRIWDERRVVARNAGAEMLITTMVHETEQNLVCDGTKAGDTTCPVTFTSKHKSSYFLADVESFSLAIYHSMRVPNFIPEMNMTKFSRGIEVCASGLEEKTSAAPAKDDSAKAAPANDDSAKAAAKAPAKDDAKDDSAKVDTAPRRLGAQAEGIEVLEEYGRFLSDGEEEWGSAGERAKKLEKMETTKYCQLYPSNSSRFRDLLHGEFDVFRLGTLFSLHNISLDTPAPGMSRTRRESGSCFILTIRYWNAGPEEAWMMLDPFKVMSFDNMAPPVNYKYHLIEVPVSEFSVRDTYYNGGWDSDSRVAVQKNGIRMLVMMTGQIGHLSLSQLLALAAAAMTTIFMAEKVPYYGAKLIVPNLFSGLLEKDKDGHVVDYSGAWQEEFSVVTGWWADDRNAGPKGTKPGFRQLPTTGGTALAAPEPAQAEAPAPATAAASATS